MSDAGATLHGRVLHVLVQYLNPIVAAGVLSASLKRYGAAPEHLERTGVTPALVQELERGLRFYSVPEGRVRECVQGLRALAPARAAQAAAPTRIEVTREAHVAEARGHARLAAEAIGFNHTDQIKIATSVSELARNIVNYAGGGLVEVTPVTAPRRGLRIRASDHGPGIPNLDQILAGNYRSKTGMGLGIRGCKKLMDEFDIRTEPSKGTEVVMLKYVP